MPHFIREKLAHFTEVRRSLKGQDPIDLNGSEFTLSFDSNTDDVWVGLVGYGHQSVHLASVTMTPEM